MTFRSLIASLMIAVAPAAASPQQQPPSRPELLSKLFGCRNLANAAERMECYDRQVAALEDAERRRDVVLVDRAEINRTRRSLFGITLPKLKLFGGDATDSEQPAFTMIEARIKDAHQSGGAWLFTLEDGARWLQSDSVDLARPAKAGQPVRIRRGSMGSFLANIDGQVAVRVRRIN